MILNPYSYGGVSVGAWFDIVTWTGTGSGSATVATFCDLSSGGMVWVKSRSAAGSHNIYYKTSAAESVRTFAMQGFSADSASTATLGVSTFTVPDNSAGVTYVAWVFRKDAANFDLLTFTGTGANQSVAHGLGSTPGVVIVRRVRSSGNSGFIQHASRGGSAYKAINSTNAEASDATYWNSTLANSTHISLGSSSNVNASGGTFLAMVFGGADTAAGQYTGNGTTQAVSVGFRPRYLLVWVTGVGSPYIYDTVRSTDWTGNDAGLTPASSSGDNTSSNVLQQDATGFTLPSSTMNVNAAQYAYLAIKE